MNFQMAKNMQLGWRYWIVIVCFSIHFPIFAYVINEPYPLQVHEKIRYASFSEAPHTLDPAKAYSVDASVFIDQIYEPPLQYNYFQRPYILEPLTLSHWDVYSRKETGYSIYHLTLKPGIFYQPHPAFARCGNEYCYLQLNEAKLKNIKSLKDFSQTGTRELRAEDYVYEIKRLASPHVQSPIRGLMEEHIVGFKEFGKTIENYHKTHREAFIDLRQFSLSGVKVISPYELEIWIKGQYPEFRYWLAMSFFAPVPWEADQFYAQKGMAEHYLSLDWYPVGTGPFMLIENNPNREIVLVRNPYFHPEYFPQSSNPEDEQKGYTKNAGKRLPFLDKIIFTLEKESIPRWNKFIQGYYDSSGISADSFDQAIKVNTQSMPYLSQELQEKGIRLETFTEPSLFYIGFNMLDPIVGGYSEPARKLRQAISIAIDYEELISIFMNGRGVPAQGPLPPGVFGYGEGKSAVNEVVYNFQGGKPIRRSLEEARLLLKEAGYLNGIDPKTGNALLLRLDTPGGSPEEQAYFAWYREQLAKLGINLFIEATQFNRFQDKIRQGNAQLFIQGWRADYPDPENFLFLLYGPNSMVKQDGQNAANYENPDFDRLFEKMRNTTSMEEKAILIDKMKALLRNDAPWVWGFNPKTFVITQSWNNPVKPHSIANNLFKYADLDPKKREILQMAWNQAILWPIGVVLFCLVLLTVPLVWRYQINLRKPPKRLK